MIKPYLHTIRALHFLLAILSLSAASLCFAQPAASKQQHQRFVPGRILVKFKDGVSEDQAKSILAERGARSTKVISQIGVHIVELSPGADEQASVTALGARSEVEFAELDRGIEASARHADDSMKSYPGGTVAAHAVTVNSVTPDDYYYIIGYQWGLLKISAPEAWSITTGSSSVIVAVIDTGVDSTQPDL